MNNEDYVWRTGRVKVEPGQRTALWDAADKMSVDS